MSNDNTRKNGIENLLRLARYCFSVSVLVEKVPVFTERDIVLAALKNSNTLVGACDQIELPL